MPNEHYIDDELLRIIDEFERVVVGVLTEAGFQPDREKYWEPLRQTKDRPNSSEGQAAAVFVEIQNLRDAVERDETKSVAYIAMTMVYRFMRARYKFTWGKKLEIFQRADAGRKKSLEQGNIARKQRADEEWNPWRRRLQELLAEEVKITPAIQVVGGEMAKAGFVNPKTGEVYSDKTLWKQLPKPTE